MTHQRSRPQVADLSLEYVALPGQFLEMMAECIYPKRIGKGAAAKIEWRPVPYWAWKLYIAWCKWANKHGESWYGVSTTAARIGSDADTVKQARRILLNATFRGDPIAASYKWGELDAAGNRKVQTPHLLDRAFRIRTQITYLPMRDRALVRGSDGRLHRAKPAVQCPTCSHVGRLRITRKGERLCRNCESPADWPLAASVGAPPKGSTQAQIRAWYTEHGVEVHPMPGTPPPVPESAVRELEQSCLVAADPAGVNDGSPPAGGNGSPPALLDEPAPASADAPASACPRTRETDVLADAEESPPSVPLGAPSDAASVPQRSADETEPPKGEHRRGGPPTTPPGRPGRTGLVDLSTLPVAGLNLGSGWRFAAFGHQNRDHSAHQVVRLGAPNRVRAGWFYSELERNPEVLLELGAVLREVDGMVVNAYTRYLVLDASVEGWESATLPATARGLSLQR